MTTTDFESLKLDALAIRKRFLRMHFENQAGHIGTGLSAIDLLTYLYKKWLKKEDRFILSKGHGASSLYATLHHYGILSSEELDTYYKDGTLLPAHPAPGAWDAIPAATGSLGHGLSIATGLAYAAKKLRSSPAGFNVTCLVSDGECNEGSIWEAAMFAAHHQLDNLTVIVDANGLQGFGRTTDVMNMEPFRGKWEAFGFDVREINGHEFHDIHQSLSAPRGSRPVCILARTVKGKGVRYMEDRMEWHYLPMKKEQYEQALLDLENGGAQ
ncbi:MAG: transketolase [Bdellovibrionia bacterium]